MARFKPTVLITGANGFLGQNVAFYLEDRKEVNILKYTKDNDINDLKKMIGSADFIFHFAGENRNPLKENFEKNNVKLTEKIIGFIKLFGTNPILFFSSSVQAQNTSDYGRTKRKAEKVIKKAKESHNIQAYYYRFPNLFGQFSRPNYNSVIATFCYNLSRNKKITISDPEVSVKFLFAQDIACSLNELMTTNFQNYDSIAETIFIEKPCSLGILASKLRGFQSALKVGLLPYIVDDFDAKLFCTYASYLPINQSILEIVDLDTASEKLGDLIQKKEIFFPNKGVYEQLKLPVDCLFVAVQNAQLNFKIEVSAEQKPYKFQCEKDKTYIFFPKRIHKIYVRNKRPSSEHFVMYRLTTKPQTTA